ncbi:MAG: hypothetical protein WCD80_10520 [Desulfobaccales bacterium]
MKKPLLVGMIAAMLCLPGSAAWAFELVPAPHGYITICEGPDGMSVDVSQLTGIADTPAINQMAEFGSATATLTGSNAGIGFLAPGTRYVQLLESGNSVVSDIVQLVAEAVALADDHFIQTFTVSFYSKGYADGSLTFADLVAVSAGFPTLVETVDQQDVSAVTLLNTVSAFKLSVCSDVEFSENPLPGTLVLLGSGLLGLLVLGWRKKQH